MSLISSLAGMSICSLIGACLQHSGGGTRVLPVTSRNGYRDLVLVAPLDQSVGCPARPDTLGVCFAGTKPEATIRARGGTPRVVHTGTWGGPEALSRLQAHDAQVRRMRARIEKVFGTAKRSSGLRRTRWLGLAKAELQVRLTAIAYNLRRSWRILLTAPA
jgi:hypothetical protein